MNGDHGLTTFTDGRAKATDYVYGSANELKEINYPDSSKLTYTYDSYGRLSRTTNNRSNSYTFTYDGANRVNKQDFSQGSETDITWTYNTDRTLQTTTDGVGTTSYTYYNDGRINTVTYNYGATSLTPLQVLTYTYNEDGSVDTLTWTNGGTTVASWTYSYDGAGRLTGVSNNFSESTTYAYDGEGKITSQTNQNGTVTEYTYNEARGWPSVITHKAGGTAFETYTLTYDSGSNTVGNLTRVVEQDSSQVDYTYDGLYRLTEEVRTGTGAYSKSYGYDLAGNMTTVNGSNFGTYDDANKPTSITGATITNDTDGNVRTFSGFGLSSCTFTWDTRNKLTNQSNGNFAYKYDGTGKRTYRIVNSSTRTHYIFSGNVLIGEIAAGTPSYVYTWGAGGLISQRKVSNNTSLWYHYGPQGETRYLSNAAGTRVDSYRYTAYGYPLYSSGTDTNPFKYIGKYGYYTDGNMRLVLAGHRWYSPDLFRWISRDPIQYEGGDNLYAYVMGNPVVFIDPLGLHDEIQWKDGVAIDNGYVGLESPLIEPIDLIPILGLAPKAAKAAKFTLSGGLYKTITDEFFRFECGSWGPKVAQIEKWHLHLDPFLDSTELMTHHLPYQWKPWLYNLRSIMKRRLRGWFAG